VFPDASNLYALLKVSLTAPDIFEAVVDLVISFPFA
jgi:hypothetical protein